MQLFNNRFIFFAQKLIYCQMHVQIMLSLVYLQDLIATLAVIFTYVYVLYKPK